MKIGFRKLGSDIALNILRHVAKLALGLGLFVLIARVLGPEGNGVYSVSVLLPTLLATFLNLGIVPANVYHVGRGDVSVETAYRTSLVLWGTLSLLGLSVGSLIILFGSESLFPGISTLLLWVTLFSFPWVLMEKLLLGFLQAMQDFKRYNVVMLVAPSLTLSLAFLLVWGFEFGPLGAVIAFGSGYVLASGAAGYAVRVHLDGQEEEESWWKYTRACLGYGWKAHLSNVLAFVNYRADLYLVNFFVSPVAAGVYVIAIRIAERMWILSSAVSTVILPRLSEMHTAEAKRKYLTPLISRWMLLASLAACLGLGVVAEPLVRLLFGSAYTPAVPVLLWFLPGIVVGSFARILANDVAARGRPELNLYTSLVVVLVNILANVMLIPRYGIVGGAFATSLAYSLNGVLKLWLHAHLSGNRWWVPIIATREDWHLLRKGWATLVKERTG